MLRDDQNKIEIEPNTDNEAPVEYLIRRTKWLDFEDMDLLVDLPTVQAVVELFDVLDFYDVDFIDDIYEAIDEADDSKQAAIAFNNFIDKYELLWYYAD